EAHGLELRAQAATLRCEGPRRAPRCHYEARYELGNPSPAALRVPAAIVGSQGTDPRVTVGGVAPPERPRTELDARALAHARDTQPREKGRPLVHRGFVLEVGAGATVEVIVQTPVTLTAWGCDCGFLELERRHMVVSKDLEIEYHVDHLQGLGLRGVDERPLARTTEIPLRWKNRTRFSVTGRSLQRGRWVVHDVLTVPVAEPWTIAARPPVLLGGPFAAVGVGWRKDAGLLLRAGWEVARPAWLVGSLAVETDARTHVELVPTAEFTFPRWASTLVMFPAPGVGIGAPVQLVPTTRAGIRTHLSLAWHVVSILGVIDVYPTQREQPGKLYGGLMVQVGI
ncbi:MAG: hypothetical protein KDK70_31115, partial [Myxococcales bacterium]|nr:hypothetical protein [Myxococcales bacterium]